MPLFKKLDLLTMPLLFLVLGYILNAQEVTLNQNSGGIFQGLINTSSTCTDEGISYGRGFVLQDFGVTGNDEFLLDYAEIAIKQWYRLDEVGMIRFNIYEIDENFPNSFDPTKLIGSSQDVELPRVAPIFAIGPVQLLKIDFDNPIIIPAGTKRVFVEVTAITPLINSVYAVYTVGETDPAYFKTCDSREYVTALENAVPTQGPAGFVFPYYYLKAFGTRNTISDFHINYVSDCSNLSASFELTDTHKIASVIWDFGDPASAADNNSTNLSPTHIFSTAGTFSIEAQITTETGNELCINTEVTVTDNLSAYPVADLMACENMSSLGISSTFSTSIVEATILGGQRGLVVSYLDSEGNPLPSPLPNPMSNSKPGRETITARVADPNNPDCYKEINFDLVVQPVPFAFPLEDLVWCSSDDDGIAEFDTSGIESIVVGNQTGMEVSYFDVQGSLLPDPLPNPYTNIIPYQETITVRVSNPISGCYTETPLNLVVSPQPVVHSLNDLVAQDDDGDGFVEFDTSGIEIAVVGNQIGTDVSYFDAQGAPLPSPLPDPYTNTTPHQETITVVVTNPLTGCSVQTPLNLRVLNTPIVGSPTDLYACDEGNGFAYFDVSSIESQVIGTQTGLNVSYLDANGMVLQNFPSNFYKNQNPYSQTVTVHVTDQSDPAFHAETAFDLIVNPLPVVHALPDLIMCDDDGITEFDTSEVEGAVVGNQTGLEISYIDAEGSPIPYPLPNPYTNSVPHLETITVVVTNPLTGCSVETSLTLRTLDVPDLQPLPNVYACDEGDGHALFDTSSLETQILGERDELQISYLDSDGQKLSGFPSDSYRNQVPYSQTVTARVAREDSPNCYSEVSFDLIVIQPPVIDLQETYYLCDQETSRTISATPDADSWIWVADDGTILSSSSEVDLSEEGNYTLFMGKTQNGIYCENSASFRLVRIEPTLIQQLNTGEDFSGDNHIEVLASGEGNLEYSIDGEHYQDDNMFHGLPGGIYTVYVRDKDGCGKDSRETLLLDYPKFFSPNSDGINDRWQIKALSDFPDAVIQIFDRYGKLLGQIGPNDNGWDGTFKGSHLPSSDYWFILNLGDGREYKKHFTLKR